MATTTTAAAPANDIGFLLAAGTGIAFVVGAACASCSRGASCSASLTRTLAFSTSTFVFIGGALGDLLPFARGAFEKMQETDHEAESRQHTARGLGQSFATASFVIGVVLQFSVNYVVARLLASATACHSTSQLPGTQHTTASLNRHVSLTIPAWMDSDSASTGDGVDFEPNSSGAVAFDAMQAVERVFEMSAAQSSKCADHDLSAKSKTYKRSLSVLAILAHHLPGSVHACLGMSITLPDSLFALARYAAGAIVYITAMVQPRLGQVLAFAVVLHSVPGASERHFHDRSLHSVDR